MKSGTSSRSNLPDGIAADIADPVGEAMAWSRRGWLQFAGAMAAAPLVTACAASGSRTESRRGDDIPGKRATCRAGADRLDGPDAKLLRQGKVGLITNHTGHTRAGLRTVDVLHEDPLIDLVALFGPEHGIGGRFDQAKIADGRDEATGLLVHSLYGERRSPDPAILTNLDVLVFDIQDAGCRFYTYLSTMAMAMEACAAHGKSFVVLDRPNPLGGVAIEGPIRDGARTEGDFVAYHDIPVRHGMTAGELARMFRAERGLDLDLQIVPMEGWNPSMLMADTGLPWTPPSPNLRTVAQALLYPGVGLIEFTNVSVGRGTDAPFERIGAPFIDGVALTDALGEHDLPGVGVSPVRFRPKSSKHANTECGGVLFTIHDARALQPVRLGLTLMHVLHETNPQAYDTAKLDRLLQHEATAAGVLAHRAPEELAKAWRTDEDSFATRRKPYLLY